MRFSRDAVYARGVMVCGTRKRLVAANLAKCSCETEFCHSDTFYMVKNRILQL